MINLRFNPIEEPAQGCYASGSNFGEAAYRLLQVMIQQYGFEAIGEPIFTALAELKDGDETRSEWRDMSQPETNFDLELIST